jgi:hypothetical protein
MKGSVGEAVEVIIDFNGFYLQSAQVIDVTIVPSLGQAVFFDGKIWQVEQVIRTLDISTRSKPDQLVALLTLLYGKVGADKLLAGMTALDQTFAGQSSLILAPPTVLQVTGKFSRFIYIKLSREHD